MQATHFMRYFVTDSEGTKELQKPTGKSLGLFHHRNGASFDVLRLFRHIRTEYGQYRIILDADPSWSSWALMPFARWLFGGTSLPRRQRLRSKNAQGPDEHFQTMYALYQMISNDEDVPQQIFPDRNGCVTSGDRSFFYRAGAITTAAALDVPMQDYFDGLPTDTGGLCGTTRTTVKEYRPQDMDSIAQVPSLGPSATYDDWLSWFLTQRYNISKRISQMETQYKAYLDHDDSVCGECRDGLENSQWTCRILFSEDQKARNHPKCSQ